MRKTTKKKDTTPGSRIWPWEDEVKLMTYYECNEILWTNNMPNGQEDIIRRKNCWQKMSDVIGYPVDTLQRRIRSMRRIFTEELNAIKRSRSGAEYTEPTPRNKYIFEKMKWLEPYLRTRNSKSNMEKSNLQNQGDGGLFYKKGRGEGTAEEISQCEEKFHQDAQNPDELDVTYDENDNEEDSTGLGENKENDEGQCDDQDAVHEEYSDEDDADFNSVGDAGECREDQGIQFDDSGSHSVYESDEESVIGSVSSDESECNFENEEEVSKSAVSNTDKSPSYPSDLFPEFDSQPISPLRDLSSINTNWSPRRKISIGMKQQTLSDESESEEEPDESQSILLAPNNYPYSQANSTMGNPEKQSQKRRKLDTSKSEKTADTKVTPPRNTTSTTNKKSSNASKRRNLTNSKSSKVLAHPDNVATSAQDRRCHPMHSGLTVSKTLVDVEKKNAANRKAKSPTKGKHDDQSKAHPLTLTRKSRQVPSSIDAKNERAIPPVHTQPPTPRALVGFRLDNTLPTSVPEKFRDKIPKAKKKTTPQAKSKTLNYDSDCDFTDDLGHTVRSHFTSKSSLESTSMENNACSKPPPNTLMRPVNRRKRSKKTNQSSADPDMEAEKLALKQQQLQQLCEKNMILAQISKHMDMSKAKDVPTHVVPIQNNSEGDTDFFCQMIKSIVSQIESPKTKHEYMLEVHRIGVEALNGTWPPKKDQQSLTPNTQNVPEPSLQSHLAPNSVHQQAYSPSPQVPTGNTTRCSPQVSFSAAPNPNTSSWLTTENTPNQTSHGAYGSSNFTSSLSDVASSFSSSYMQLN